MPTEQAITWSTRFERIPKCFIFLVIARGVVNVICGSVINLLAKKARPDQSFEQNMLCRVSLKLYASNLKNKRLINFEEHNNFGLKIIIYRFRPA